MFEGHRIKVIIPAHNEEASIGKVLDAIGQWVDEVIVVDNDSSDQTGDVARGKGAQVVHERRRGYGQACLSGISHLGECDIVVFLDADYSDYPQEMDKLVGPIAQGEVDMVIGSRSGQDHNTGVMNIWQVRGNQLACFLMRLIWRHRYTDLGPFRAIRMSSLRRLQMTDRNYGWTVEMQIKALRCGLRVTERALRYRQRIGESKISGTIKGVFGAGTKILWTIFREAISPSSLSRSSSDRLIVFSRYPKPHRTKTRLIPAIGATGAAQLHRDMYLSTLKRIQPLITAGVDVEIRYTGGSRRQMRRLTGNGFTLAAQKGRNLGERMRNAFTEAQTNGCERTVMIGTDCPNLSAEHIREAFAALSEHDLVLGPGSDGGYWLIGLREPNHFVSDVAWGSSTVLAETLKQAKVKGLSICLLEELADVDTEEDLKHLGPSCPVNRVYLSIIIPTLNEADRIEATIKSVQTDNVEIIVADGGSSDDTVARAQALGATVVRSKRGRAKQMNQGAQAAKGKVLLFLHGDTLLESQPTSGPTEKMRKDFIAEIFDTLCDQSVAGGAFRFKTDLDHPLMQVIERLVNFRSSLLGLPYGDQGLFVRKEVFEHMGGFAEVAIGEDYFFVRKMRKQGRLCQLTRAAVTSARRWRKHGMIRTTLRNQLILAGLMMGVSDKKLARLYQPDQD